MLLKSGERLYSLELHTYELLHSVHPDWKIICFHPMCILNPTMRMDYVYWNPNPEEVVCGAYINDKYAIVTYPAFLNLDNMQELFLHMDIRYFYSPESMMMHMDHHYLIKSRSRAKKIDRQYFYMRHIIDAYEVARSIFPDSEIIPFSRMDILTKRFTKRKLPMLLKTFSEYDVIVDKEICRIKQKIDHELVPCISGEKPPNYLYTLDDDDEDLPPFDVIELKETTHQIYESYNDFVQKNYYGFY